MDRVPGAISHMVELLPGLEVVALLGSARPSTTPAVSAAGACLPPSCFASWDMPGRSRTITGGLAACGGSSSSSSGCSVWTQR